MKIISWNVNGIRAVEKKGFIDWVKESGADVIGIQETKAQEEQLSEELLNIEGYKSYFKSAVKKGYSGVCFYTKQEPLKIEDLGVKEFDDEGRVIIAHYDKCSVVNCYFPNSQAEGARLDYKLRFCEAILEKCDSLVKEGKNIVLCGDYNIAHTAIDLKNPKTNEKNPGYLPQEREWMSKFLSAGYSDVFREAHKDEEGHYTWWSYRFSARSKNVGWRIDYLCVNEGFKEGVSNPTILKDVMGSDHCPVGLEIL
ncbi:MAG: exodeoxyribonuclease III [Campylobacterales bacterium]|nr:exodeoxyribonuclease III [Campylobacterales bacterium]